MGLVDRQLEVVVERPFVVLPGRTGDRSQARSGTNYGAIAVARLINAAVAPVAGSGPSREDPVGPGLIARKRDPAATARIALVMFSQLYVRVSPTTT